MFNFSKKNKYTKRFNRGFTLIESLVAISILSLSIAAAFTAVQGGLQSSSFAKDQITAFYLAQEGMEFLRNVRDVNALYSVDGNPRNWLNGISENASDPCYFGKTCTVDSKLKAITDCGGAFGSCPNIKQDPTTKLYGYTAGWTDTAFKREIQLQNVVAGQEIAITIKISWTTRGSTKSFQVTQSLFNHQ